MDVWKTGAAFAVFVMAGVALFLFLVTRGTLLLRGALASSESETSHVYPIYSDMRLIRIIDHQPIISAILLFQYHRLVSTIVSVLERTNLKNKKVLITSCAFGNVIPRIVDAAFRAGAERVLIADIVKNELIHAKRKLGIMSDKVDFIEENAVAMQHDDGMVDINVIFFLLHELPDDSKARALKEADRLLTPSGKMIIAEFHRPQPGMLRALSWAYFKVFEPFGLALWGTHDPVSCLDRIGNWACKRLTFLFGNFQVIVATKQQPRPRQ